MTLEELMKKRQEEKAKQAQQNETQQAVPAQAQAAQETQKNQVVENKQTQQEQKTETNMTQENKQQTQQTQQVTSGSEDAQATYEDEQKQTQQQLDVTKFIGTAETHYTKPLLEEDLYNAELLELRRQMMKNFQTGADEEKYIWRFKIISDMAGNLITEDKNHKTFEKGILLTQYTNLSYGPKSNNYHLYSQLMKKEPELGEQYNLLDCVGKKCRIMTKNVTSKKDNTVFTVIDKVCQAK